MLGTAQGVSPPSSQEPQAAAESSPSDAPATVHGEVRNAATGAPLPRALVRIEGDADTGALTDGDGRFEIPDVPVGPQTLDVIKPGFLDEAFFPSGTSGLGTGPGAKHSIVVAAQMPELIFTMTPTNSIRGRIELSTGDSAQGIGVTLVGRLVEDGQSAWKAISPVKTNGEGVYRFARLGDGEYAVYTEPAMDSEPATNLVAPGSDAHVTRNGYPSQFYPEARELAGATKIHLAGGKEAEANILLTLEPFHTVTAEVELPGGRRYGDENPALAGMNLSALVMDAQGHPLPYNAEYDQTTRTVQAILPDGSYSFAVTVTFSRFTAKVAGNDTLTAAMDGAPMTGQVDFSVAGHAVSKLRVPLSAQRNSPVQVTVVRSGAEPASANSAAGEAGTIFVTLREAGERVTNGMVNVYASGAGPGQLETTFILPGSYWAQTIVAQPGLCVGSFTAGGANLAREPLTIGSSGTTTPLSLTLRDDCARLTLTLPTADAAQPPGEELWYTVYVTPDFDTTEGSMPQTLRPSSGGAVTLEGLTPGNYHVYTFAAPVVLEYRNPAALAALPAQGQAVTLSPGATSNLVLEVPGR